MKSHELLDAVGGIDPKHVNAAAEAETKKHGKAWMGWVAAAACLALVLSLVVPVFKNHHIGSERHPFLPHDVMRTDGEWIYFARAATQTLYLIRVDGENTEVAARAHVELPFETGPDMEIDFWDLYVKNDLLYLLGTRAENQDPDNADIAFEFFLEVYSIDNHASFQHVSSFQQNGDFYTWRTDGDNLFMVASSLDPNEKLYYIANGEKTMLDTDSIEIEDPSGDLFLITAIDTASGTKMTVRRAAIKNFDDDEGFTDYEKFDAWLDTMITAEPMWTFKSAHTEDLMIGEVSLRQDDDGWVTISHLVQNGQILPDQGGERIGDLLYVYAAGTDLHVVSPETLEIVKVVSLD